MKWISSVLCVIAPLIGFASAFEEIIEGGYKIIHTGPKSDASKFAYEKVAIDTALPLLQSRLGPEGLDKYLQPVDGVDESKCQYLKTKDGGPTAGPKDQIDLFCLGLLKRKIGDDALEDYLRPDIDSANKFWTDIVAKSTPNSHISADASTIVFFPYLSASAFAKWTQSPAADEANNDAEPEHWYKHTIPVNETTMAAQILEGWGGTTTRFNILDYTLIQNGKSDKYPFLRPMEGFPIQAVGGKNLVDGLVFGVLHIGLRDVKGSDHGSDIDGVEIYATVWYGDALEDTHLEFERQHMVVESVNLAWAASKANSPLQPPS